MKKKFYVLLFAAFGFVCSLAPQHLQANVFSQATSPATCPTASDLYYYYTPILNSSGVLTGYRIYVCKKTPYSACGITVTLSVSGRGTGGGSTSSAVTVVIPASATCGSADVTNFAQIECIYFSSIVCNCGSGCLTPPDFNVWAEPISDGEGGIINFGLNACKIPIFTACDVIVNIFVTGINGSGNYVTSNQSVWIARNQTCGITTFGHTWQEVWSVEVTGVVCINCTGRYAGTEVAPKTAEQEPAAKTVAKVQVFPNPASGAFTVQYRAAAQEQITVEIATADGKVAEQKNETAGPGLNNFRYNTTKLAPGIYFIKLVQNGRMLHLQKLVIAK